MADNKIQIIIEAIDRTKAAFSSNLGSIAKLKESWMGLSAAAYAGYQTLQKAMDYIEQGARAMQAETAYAKTAESVGVNGDKMLSSMRETSAGAIDESQRMQLAIKAMAQDVDPNKIPELFDAARVAAVKSGEDIGTVADVIIDAIANEMPRGLRRFGLVTKEEFSAFNKAVGAGAENLNLLDVLLNNEKIQAAKMGVENHNAAIQVQQFKAELKDLKETIGKGLIGALEMLLGLMKGIGAGSLLASAGIWRVVEAERSLRAMVSWGDAKKEHEAVAKTAGENARADMEYAQGLLSGKLTLTGKTIKPKNKTQAELDADAAKAKTDNEKILADWKKMGMSAQFIDAQKSLMQADIQGIQNELSVARENYKLLDALADQHYKLGLIGEEDYLKEKERLKKADLLASMAALEKEKTATESGYKSMIAAVLPNKTEDRNKLIAEQKKEIARIDGEIAKAEIDLQIVGKEGDIDAIERMKKMADITREGVLNRLQEEIKLRAELNGLKVERGTMTESSATAQEIEGNRSILELQRQQIAGKIASGGLTEAEKTGLENQLILISRQIESLDAVSIEKEKQRRAGENTLEIERQRLENTYKLREELAKETGDYRTMYDMQARSSEIERSRALLKVRKTFGYTQEDIDAVNRYYDEQQRRIESMQTPLGAFTQGLVDVVNTARDANQQMYDLSKGTAKSMSETFSNVFFDAWTGKLQSAGDYFRSFATSVLRTWSDMISEMITRWATIQAITGITKLVGSAAGAGAGASGGSGGAYTFGGGAQSFTADPSLAPTAHGGGEVGKLAFYRLVLNPDLIPRRHGGGLAPDERMTINKVGERFVTAEQNDWLSAIARKMDRPQPETVLKQDIVNIVSPDMLDAYLATARGQNAVLNLISSKSGIIRRVLGNV